METKTNPKTHRIQAPNVKKDDQIYLSGGVTATVSGEATSTDHGHFIPTLEFGRVYAEKGTTFKIRRAE